MDKITIAIMYDFDKTLSAKDQQEYSFIPSLGMEAGEFWGEADKLAKQNNMDRILAYMYLMIKEAKKKDVPVTRESLNKLGEDIKYFPGVASWFKRINEYGEEHGVNIEHYILSSGLTEIIEGTSIAKYFKKIFACEFHYTNQKNADFPARIVNYTLKTQFIFRISKGALDLYDDDKVNSYVADNERRVAYNNMIYIGDGLTDVPCMQLVRDKGGEAIALYNKKDTEKVHILLKERRVGFGCKADYKQDSELDKTVKKIIDKMVLNNEMEQLHEKQVREAIEALEDKEENE